MDAQSTLKTLFRQLSSALHPDRETDPEARERKTVLMSQVNVAYERKDLSALLHLQAQTAALDEQAMSSWADDKIEAMNSLLKQQVRDLEDAVSMREWHLSQALGFHVSAKTSQSAMDRHLAKRKLQEEDWLKQLQQDLIETRELVTLKPWIKWQRTLGKQLAQQQAMLDDLMGEDYPF